MSFRISTASLLVISFLSLPAAAQTVYNFNQSSDDSGDELAAPPASMPVTAAPAPMPAAMPATDAQIRIQSLEGQIRNLNGVIEKLQFSNQQLTQQMQRMAGDHDVRFQQLEKRLTEAEAALKAAAEKPAAPAPEPEAAPEKPATEKPSAEKPAASAPEAEKPGDKTLGTLSSNAKTPDAEAQKLYDEAFLSLRQTRYDEAESKFKSFLKNFPKHKLTENAQYWLAETYYVRGKFAESAVAFAETYQKFPQGAKAADNLLKMAMSLGALDKKPDACATLGELKKRFPNASSIIRNRADQEKKSLGCP